MLCALRRPLGLPAHQSGVAASGCAAVVDRRDGGMGRRRRRCFHRQRACLLGPPTDRAAAPRLRRPSPSRAPHSSAAACCTCISVWLREVNEPNVSAVMFSELDGDDRLLSALCPSSVRVVVVTIDYESPLSCAISISRTDILYLERSVVSK